ncbi:hypothetical protein GCM10022407_09880 [Hymenobacter antarcticus]|uniref:Outer membrane protein beta-barrel domain-containing protein n=1 Tax=Hymenobacter antarcticus TaxID=486270 RepID=A0ABP7PH55_9BACT
MLATAQRAAGPDYVVTTTGDTLRGHLRQVGRHYQKVRLYRPDQQPTDFSAADIISFGSSQGPEKVARRLDPSAPPRFLTPLAEGTVSLMTGENTRHKSAFFLQLPDSANLVEVPPGNNVLVLARALPGCSAIDFGTTEFQRRYPYSRRGLTALVVDYNRCRYPKRPSRDLTRVRTTQLYFGVKAGLNVLRLELSPEVFPVSAATQNTGLQGGAMLHMATRTRFSGQAELLFVVLRSTYAPVVIDPLNPLSSTSVVSATVRYNQLQLPLLVRYTAGYGAVRPFANAGVIVASTLNNSSALHFPKDPGYNPSIDIANFTYGATVGGGLMLYQAWRPRLSLEARYLRNNTQARFGERNATVQFDAGFYF